MQVLRSEEKMLNAVRLAMAARKLEVISMNEGSFVESENYRKYQQHYLDEALFYLEFQSNGSSNLDKLMLDHPLIYNDS